MSPQPKPSAVATADQWRACLRDLVTRARHHRDHCPDEGAGVICLGRETVEDVEDMCHEHLRGLLLVALYEMAGREGASDGG